MKTIFLFIFFLFYPAVSFSQPSIVFEKERHDFGKIAYTKILEYTFEFINAGDEDLVIDQLVPS